ncbi:hypothetical protein LOK49_LG06G00648 [Camellia lanceoleosa]|uniref:Uncharacterized protein n=1 Tax=Camellia lanceoleosa TaxID=1840588 RepID=A0ACC0HI02_9ERIC|nr:hypothetical protein LOK49_LG06G00648 [Camellia lanceoleosa]
MYLGSVHKKYLEEATCNIFVLKGNLISTPPTSRTILPGITRKTLEERTVPVEELLDGYEVFCTGTAVGHEDADALMKTNSTTKEIA